MILQDLDEEVEKTDLYRECEVIVFGNDSDDSDDDGG